MKKPVSSIQRFAFGAARSLYARGVHPRVVMGPGDIPRLRAAIRSGTSARIMDGLRKKVAAVLSQFPADLGEAPTWAIADMALVGVLDECTATVSAARKALLATVKAHRNPKQAGGNIFTIMYSAHPLAYDLLYQSLSRREAATYARWLIEGCLHPILAKPYHRHYLMSAGANTPICATLPILLGLLAIQGDPGVPDLTEAYGELITRLSATLHAAIGVDGYPEEDIGYGTAVVAGLAQVIEPLRRAGLYDAYSDCPRYAKFGQAILHFVQPWGSSLSLTGDYGGDFCLCRELVLARQAEETRTPELLWLLGKLVDPIEQTPVNFPNVSPSAVVALQRGDQVPATGFSLLFAEDFKPACNAYGVAIAGRQAVRPRPGAIPTAYRDRTRGIVSFRSGWDDDATFVVFDGSQRSPAGQGHAHDSAGHFSLTALGEYFAIDTGRYSIEQNCHNVVLIDGRSGRSTDGQWRMSYYHGNLLDYSPGAFCDFASVDSSHQHNCFWARRYLGLVKGAGAHPYVWIVEDINKANDWAEFWWQLQTSPENTITLQKAGAVIRGWRKGNFLDIRFFLPASGSYPLDHTLTFAQDVTGPSSYKYASDPKAAAAKAARPADMVHRVVFQRPRLLAKVAGYNGRFMSVLLPRRKGEAPARVTALESLANSFAARITFAEVEDTLIFAYEHNQLEAGGVRGRGQWCVVRRSRKTGRVLARELGAGTSLTVDRESH